VFKHYKATLTSYPYASVNAFNLFALSGGNFAAETGNWLILTYRTWGTIFIILATLASLWIYFRSDSNARLYLMGMFLTVAVFVFASRMHERYLFPVLMFCLLAALSEGSRRLMVIFTGFSITFFLNVGYVLFANMRGISHISPHDPLLLFTSAANLVLFAYLVRYLLKQRKPRFIA
jgi:dolichyl-phosphate-mannose-protein mannosyltransferase